MDPEVVGDKLKVSRTGRIVVGHFLLFQRTGNGCDSSTYCNSSIIMSPKYHKQVQP